MATRREFGISLAALAGVTGYAPAAFAHEGEQAAESAVSANRVAAQVYVFMQHHARQNSKLRDHIPEMLAAHHEAGIRNLELMGDLLEPELLPALRAGSEEQGFRYPVVYSGAHLYERGSHAAEAERLAVLAGNARRLGTQFLNCNPDPKPKKAPKSAAELSAEAEGINLAARAVREEGLTLLLHNHDAEMQDEAANWRYWLNHTDPALVSFCLDTHWVCRGGADALELLTLCRPRLEELHLRNSRQRIWWEELDDGDLDYRPIAEFLAETNYRGLLTIELAWDKDTVLTRPMADNLRRSRSYAERRFL